MVSWSQSLLDNRGQQQLLDVELRRHHFTQRSRTKMSGARRAESGPTNSENEKSAPPPRIAPVVLMSVEPRAVCFQCWSKFRQPSPSDFGPNFPSPRHGGPPSNRYARTRGRLRKAQTGSTQASGSVRARFGFGLGFQIGSGPSRRRCKAHLGSRSTSRSIAPKAQNHSIRGRVVHLGRLKIDPGSSGCLCGGRRWVHHKSIPGLSKVVLGSTPADSGSIRAPFGFDSGRFAGLDLGWIRVAVSGLSATGLAPKPARSRGVGSATCRHTGAPVER